MLSPQDLQMNISNSYDRDMANAYVEYERKKDELSYIDFDDMIYKTVRLLRSSTEARELYQKQFKYVLADEGQDTNDAQYALLDLLTAEHNNLFVVADVDQSIYRWRGAKVQNMIQFQSSYPNSKIYKLEQNYRSTANIVNAANAVILNNEERLEKTAWTDNPPGDPIILFSAENDDNEAQFVSEAIHRIVEVQSRPYTDFAILYRTGRQSRMIELALTKIGIPYQVVGGKSFYDRKEIKDLVGYLRIVANPHDSLAYERVINVPKRGIGDTTVKKIDQYAKECFIPFSRGLEHIADVPKISKGTQAKILAFNELITLIREESFREGITILEILQNIMRRTDFMSQFDPEKEDDESRIENIKELLRVASDWDESNTNDKDLIDFLSETTLVTDTEDSETQEKVSLMTTHSSKGLEYPCVFIVGMEEGIFPHGRSLGNPQELEEERRLAYVAMTRAERKLFITHCKNRYEYNDPRPRRNRPSRFISEIPEELIKRIG
jgi:DNA helicase-2/ATP-dependent DNA helicase PcrA